MARQLAFQGHPTSPCSSLSTCSTRLERFWAVAQQRFKGLIVVLQDVERLDAGAILRCCDAFGVQEVHFVFEKMKRFDPLANRQVTKSEGSNLWVCSRVFGSQEECLKHLRERGFKAFRLVQEPREPLFQLDVQQKLALWLGDVALEPVGLVGPLAESSLVAAALGDIARRRRAPEWRLSPEEQQAPLGLRNAAECDAFIIFSCVFHLFCRSFHVFFDGFSSLRPTWTGAPRCTRSATRACRSSRARRRGGRSTSGSSGCERSSKVRAGSQKGPRKAFKGHSNAAA